jgi:hypothetical protein
VAKKFSGLYLLNFPNKNSKKKSVCFHLPEPMIVMHIPPLKNLISHGMTNKEHYIISTMQLT